MSADHSHTAGQQGTGNQRSISRHREQEKNKIKSEKAVHVVSGGQEEDVLTLTSAQLGYTCTHTCVHTYGCGAPWF